MKRDTFLTMTSGFFRNAAHSSWSFLTARSKGVQLSSFRTEKSAPRLYNSFSILLRNQSYLKQPKPDYFVKIYLLRYKQSFRYIRVWYKELVVATFWVGFGSKKWNQFHLRYIPTRRWNYSILEQWIVSFFIYYKKKRSSLQNSKSADFMFTNFYIYC